MFLAPLATGLIEALPWCAAWHGLFWLFRAASPTLFGGHFMRLDNSEKGYWAASMVSTVHAVYVGYLALHVISDLSLFTSPDLNPTSEASFACLRVLLGFIMSDLCISLYYGSKWSGNTANIIHHVAVLIVWNVFISLGVVHSLAMFATLMELTTPFINLRWFLAKCGKKSTTLYKVNGMVMVLSWFLLRICMFMWAAAGLLRQNMWDQVWSMPQIGPLPSVVTSLIILFFTFVGASLQFFWFRKMVKGAMKALSSNTSSSKTR